MLHRMLPLRRVIARIAQLVRGSMQGQKKLGFLAQLTQNEEKPIWNSDCAAQRYLSTKNIQRATWHVYIDVLLNMSAFF